MKWAAAHWVGGKAFCVDCGDAVEWLELMSSAGWHCERCASGECDAECEDTDPEITTPGLLGWYVKA